MRRQLRLPGSWMAGRTDDNGCFPHMYTHTLYYHCDAYTHMGFWRWVSGCGRSIALLLHCCVSAVFVGRSALNSDCSDLPPSCRVSVWHPRLRAAAPRFSFRRTSIHLLACRQRFVQSTLLISYTCTVYLWYSLPG